MVKKTLEIYNINWEFRRYIFASQNSNAYPWCLLNPVSPTVVCFIYKHISYINNFMLFVSYTLISFIYFNKFYIQSWIGGTVGCINRSIFARLSMNAFYAAWDRIIEAIASIITDRNFYMRHRSYDDLDVQELILSMSMHISSSMYEIHSEVSKMYKKDVWESILQKKNKHINRS